jgi:hypothetical protein
MSETMPTPADLSPGDRLRIEYEPVGFDDDSHEIEAIVENIGGNELQRLIDLRRPKLEETLNSEARLEFQDGEYMLQGDMHDTEGYEYRSTPHPTVELI